MFSKRVITFLVLLFTFGMFALASPVDTTGLVARDSSIAASEAAIVARTGDSAQAVIDLLLKLKVDIEAKIALLDYVNVGPILDIIALINACVQVIVKLDVAVDIKADVLVTIVGLVAAILNLIVGALVKFNLLVIVTVCLQVDLCLSAFINAVIAIIPGFLGVFTKGLITVDLFVKLKLVLTLTALGLGNLLGGLLGGIL